MAANKKSKNKNVLLSFIKKHIPIIRWIESYSRMKFISDIIAGVTVGVTMIPQSIAYAALAGLSPQRGLNSAFVGCFVYAIFGTIKEVSIGPTSMMALFASTYTANLNLESIVFVTFITGIIEFFMGLLRLGVLVEFISVPVIGGFVSAIAIIIIVSQLKDLMGLQFKSGNVVRNFVSVIRHSDEVRYSDLTLGILCMIVLLLLRSLKDVKLKGKNKDQSTLQSIIWYISLSRNAIVVFFCIILAAAWEFYFGKVPFELTESVDSGLPTIKLPPFSAQVGNVTYSFIDMTREIGTGLFIIPIVSFLENIAIAKAFSKGKTIDATQEMFALSLSNIMSSFVGAMPTCGALTRSAVSSASGVQSPIASIYSGAVVLLAVAFLTPYFHFIPRATLAAVLICAIVFLIEWELLIPLWKTSKRDFSIMLFTFIISLSFGVEIGLLIGVGFSLMNLLYLWARPTITSEIYTVSSGEKYILLTVDKGLYFPSLSCLRESILKQQMHEHVNLVVINCTYFSGFDYSAVKELSLLINALNEHGEKLLLLNANNRMIELCQTVGHCKGISDYHYHSREELEIALNNKEVAAVKKSNEYSINVTDIKAKEVRPLLQEVAKKDNTAVV